MDDKINEKKKPTSMVINDLETVAHEITSRSTIAGFFYRMCFTHMILVKS